MWSQHHTGRLLIASDCWSIASFSSFVENDWQHMPHPYNLNTFVGLSFFFVESFSVPVHDTVESNDLFAEISLSPSFTATTEFSVLVLPLKLHSLGTHDTAAGIIVSPVCIRWCKSKLLENFLQPGKSFSPVWILLRCEFSWLLWINFLSQSEQTIGFSPVWILRCTFNWLICLNVLSQSGQAYGFSPVWILRCIFRLP